MNDDIKKLLEKLVKQNNETLDKLTKDNKLILEFIERQDKINASQREINEVVSKKLQYKEGDMQAIREFMKSHNTKLGELMAEVSGLKEMLTHKEEASPKSGNGILNLASALSSSSSK